MITSAPLKLFLILGALIAVIGLIMWAAGLPLKDVKTFWQLMGGFLVIGWLLSWRRSFPKRRTKQSAGTTQNAKTRRRPERSTVGTGTEDQDW